MSAAKKAPERAPKGAPKRAAKSVAKSVETKKQVAPASPEQSDEIILRLASIESAVEREVEMQKVKTEHGWSLTSLREDVEKTRKRVLADAAKERKEADAASGELRPALVMTGEEAIAYFNGRYAVIRVANKVRILVEDEDDKGRPTFQLLHEKDFKTESANKGVIIIPTSDDEKSVSANDFWLTSPDRREYSGLVFRPGEEMKAEPSANWQWPKFYNLWRGWGVEPSEKGSCEKYKQHLRDNVCGRREDYFDWLWKYFAHLFQKPQEKPGVGLAFRGKKGVGKSLAGEVIGKLVGPVHYIAVAQREHLVGKHNAHLAMSLFTQADEAVWTHDPTIIGALKHLITCTRRALEPKGIDTTMVDAFDRTLLTSNEDAVIPAERGERRYFALDVADTHAKDTSYFAAIVNELENGGYERLLWELLQTDLSGFDCRTCPQTDELAFQKLQNLPPHVQWMRDVLQDGGWWKSQEEKEREKKEQEPEFVNKDYVWNRYLESCRAQGRKQYLSREQFSKTLIDGLGLKPSRKREGNGERVRVYRLPELKDAREKFIATFELPADLFVDEPDIEDDDEAELRPVRVV